MQPHTDQEANKLFKSRRAKTHARDDWRVCRVWHEVEE